MLYNVAKRLKLYKFKTSNPDIIQFTELIEESVTYLCRGINGLRNLKNATAGFGARWIRKKKKKILIRK